ncbi:hypothetical protein H1W00_00775 [Aeromicrobium sp. Marseille-Q0843]|uniref:Carboxypeptidase regulatory-like domain-containing protein n=1 Tax=Aeromicrobium phoceense TaxID=2754045 RepID=A0A838XDY7_9ACTN|nr:hypothetical protein [Aeromicrobium phoceense]MBA4607008.1 hypothetical protein [Aeromicrobium phoceense]
MRSLMRAAMVAVLGLVASVLVAPAGAVQLPAAAPAGRISGSVTNTAGIPDTVDARITLSRRVAGGSFVKEASFDEPMGGAFVVPVASAGTYRVHAEVEGWGVSVRAADPVVTVAQGQTITGVDFLFEADPTISGTISTDGFNLDAPNAQQPFRVEALANSGGSWTVVATVARRTFGSPRLKIRPDGTFTLAVPYPHTSARLRFSQPHCPEFAHACVAGAAPQVLTTYWDGTPAGALTVEDAVDVDVSGGSVTDRDITVRTAPQLSVTSKARITGNPWPGQVLTASPGTYSTAPTNVDYRWEAGPIDGTGQRRVVGTGRTFRVPSSYSGWGVTVTVVPTRLGYEAPISRAGARIKGTSRIGLRAKAGKRTATVSVTVKALAVPQSKINGKASIYAKGKRIKTVNVRGGKATIKIAKQKKGKRTYTVRFSGNWLTTPSERSMKIAIR